LRVTNKKGLVIFIFPNYGSLVFRSPCSTEKIFPRSRKIIKNYLKNLKKDKIDKLNWTNTEPMLNVPFKPDHDTLCEPDLITLNKFLKNKGCKIITSETYWIINNFSKKSFINLMAQVLVFILGLFQVSPFKYWGLNVIIVAQKE
jgi:hypothetical protein